MKPIVLAYKVEPDGFGGHRYCAMLPIQVSLPIANAPRTKRFETIIDSGATRTMFHVDFANHFGIDLANCQTEKTRGISGDEITYLHDVKLFIPGGPIVTKAAFKEKLPIAGLLGMSGFFEYFRVTFDGPAQQCTLERIFQAYSN